MPSTLAFAIFTVLEPSDLRGLQFETIEPVECAEYIDGALPEFEAAGLTVMAQCRYTTAPAQSLPPRLRDAGNG